MTQIGLTTLVNNALILLGSTRRIESFDYGSLGSQASDLLAVLVPDLLAAHPWNFALCRADVPRENLEPALGDRPWRFQLPADCLRWLPWDREDSNYFDAVEEGDRLLACTPDPICIRYIRNVQDPTKWSAGFRALLTAEIAYALAETVSESQSQRDRMEQKAEKAIRAAKRADGLASQTHKRLSPARASNAVRAMQGGGRGDPARSHR